jgi:hypothetical protein
MLALAACGNGKAEPELMNLRSGQGPDEFAIVPPKPLEMPESLADLPEPTPGGFQNRTDQNPEDDAAMALGGKPRQRAASRRVILRFTPMRRGSGRWRHPQTLASKTWNGGATTTAASWNGCST